MLKLTFTEEPTKKDKDAHPLAVIVGGRYDGEILNTATVGFKPEVPENNQKKKRNTPRDLQDIGQFTKKIKKSERGYWEQLLADTLREEEEGKEAAQKAEDKRIQKEENTKLKGLTDSVHASLDFSKEFFLKDGLLQPIPDDLWFDRSVLFCFGQAGSGKSTFVRKWCEKWKKQPFNKKKNVYYFSRLTEDTSMDSLKPERVKLDDAFVLSNRDAYSFPEGSMLIFDDIDTLPSKAQKEAVYKLLNDCLEVGRHRRLSICMTSHQGSNYGQTRTILNECNYIVSTFALCV